MRMNWRKALLSRAASSSQNRPFTVTSMTSSGVSLQVARCSTWLTPSIARATKARSAMLPFTTSTREVSGSVRLWQSARIRSWLWAASPSRRCMNACPTLPVAPVTRMRRLAMELLPDICQTIIRTMLAEDFGGGQGDRGKDGPSCRGDLRQIAKRSCRGRPYKVHAIGTVPVGDAIDSRSGRPYNSAGREPQGRSHSYGRRTRSTPTCRHPGR